MSIDEGIIKFNQQLQITEPLSDAFIASLNETRTILFTLKLIGEYSELKIGYGNLSLRDAVTTKNEHAFIISGSQTGHLPILDGRHYCKVVDFDLSQNRIFSKGPIEASSESLTHGAIYECSPNIQAVIHIHCREIWQGMLADDLPQTAADIPYGTLEMANAVKHVIADSTSGCLAMAGHEDGVICYAENLGKALTLCQELYARYVNAALLKN